MAYGYNLEAEYEDGFILSEKNDFHHTIYVPGNPTIGSVFGAILEKEPVKAGHGEMIRYSLVPDQWGSQYTNRYDVNWKLLWKVENPRPIYFRRMISTLNLGTGGDSGPQCVSHHFGFQYIDENGQNVERVVDIEGP